MVFPIGDDNSDRTSFPAVNVALIAVNVLVFVLLNASGPSSLIPSLGASGAISGVMGAYLLLHPGKRVTVLLFRIVTEVPGFVAVGLWFVFQLISGIGMLGGVETGVAYGAHIGGFVAGAVLAKPFMLGLGHDRSEPRSRVRYR